MPSVSKHTRKSTIQPLSSSHKGSRKTKAKSDASEKKTFLIRAKVQKIPLRDAKSAQDKIKKERIRTLEQKIREIKSNFNTTLTAKKTQALTKKLEQLQTNLTKHVHNFMSGKTIQEIVKKIQKHKLATPIQLTKRMPTEVKTHYLTLKQLENEVTKHIQHALTLAHKVDQMYTNCENPKKIQDTAQRIDEHLEKAKLCRNHAMQTAKAHAFLPMKTKEKKRKHS